MRRFDIVSMNEKPEKREKKSEKVKVHVAGDAAGNRDERNK